MLINYLKIAYRNLLKNKGFSFIQIAGLAIGISIALVIVMLVKHEYSYDVFHRNGDRIYRIVSESRFNEEVFPNSGVPAPLAEAVENEISGLETVVAFHIWDHVKVSVLRDGKVVKTIKPVNDIIFTTPDYFNLFSNDWLAGSPDQSLSEPYQVVLSESKAKEYFPYEDVREAVGKIIMYQDSIQTTVSGIVKDPTGLTDFTFSEFISISTIENTYLKDEFYIDTWDNIASSSQLFVKLKDGVEASSINAQFPALLKKYLKPDNTQGHELQPLNDIHFNEIYDNFDKRSAHKGTLNGLLLLSFFLLILACINYVNLTTAQSSTRQREISVRKTFGSSKKQLIFQFLSESITKVFIAAIISLLLLPFIFNHFSDFLPEELKYQDFINIENAIVLIIFILIIGFAAGTYPAFILAAFRPAWLIKGKSSGNESGHFLFRQGLIVFQFAIAFCLIIGAFTVSRQIKFGLTKELGYAKDGIINIPLPWKSDPSKNVQFFEKINNIAEIDFISLGGQPPASHSTISRTMEFSLQRSQEPIHAEFKYGGPDYVKIYNLKVIAGNPLSPSDTVKEFIINETLARNLGFLNPQELIGQSFKVNEQEKTIVGVVADFHSKSMHQPVKPLVITSDINHYDFVHLKLSPYTENWESVFKKSELAWQEVFPDEPFSYQFFDEKIASFYDREMKLNKLLNWATGIAIFISCLGLIGIVAFTIQQKTKEIGIRKVLGASISGILMLLSKGFVKLIIIAFSIATPIGYYLINEWLKGFEYKIEINWWLFVIPGLTLLVISVIVLSTQSIKAALANPVESLRNE